MKIFFHSKMEKTDELLTIKELMQMLKISRPTAYRYIEKQMFDVYKVGKNIRIGKQSVLDYLSQNKR